MADKRNEEREKRQVSTGRRIDMDLPVNQTVTLPSAEKPATPPKGKGKGAKNGLSTGQGGRG
jgi:hypothetical protein